MAQVRYHACPDCLTGHCSFGADCPCVALDGYACDDKDVLAMTPMHGGCYCTWDYTCRDAILPEDTDGR